MAAAINEFELEELVQEQERIARLEATTVHIQSDVSRIDAKMDALIAKIDALKDCLNTRHIEMKDSSATVAAGFAAVDSKRAKLEAKVDAGFAAIGALIEAKFASLDVARARDRVWLMSISGALLGVVARAFHWI